MARPGAFIVLVLAGALLLSATVEARRERAKKAAPSKDYALTSKTAQEVHIDSGYDGKVRVDDVRLKAESGAALDAKKAPAGTPGGQSRKRGYSPAKNNKPEAFVNNKLYADIYHVKAQDGGSIKLGQSAETTLGPASTKKGGYKKGNNKY